VTYKETRSWEIPEHGWLWVSRFQLRRLARRTFTIAAARLVKKHVTNLQIFNHVPRHTADIRAEASGSGTRDIAYDDALERPYLRSPVWPAEASSKPEEQGRLAGIPHRNAGDRDVLALRAVHCFKRDSAATLEHAV